MYNYYDFRELLKPEEIIEYLRKSRTDDPLLTVEEVLSKHETMLDEWADRNLSGAIPEQNKFREVVSGETIIDRPEIQKVLKLIESPKIKAILVVEVQRLSRGDLEDAGRLIKLLRYTHTLVITPMKTFDLENTYDRDAFERELKRGNEFLEYQKKIMNAGRLLSVSQGNYIGNSEPYGYTKTTVLEGKRKCHTLAINEEEAEVVRMIFDMYVNQNLGVHNICTRLDELHIIPKRAKHWSPPSIRDILTNPIFIGKVRWNWRKTITSVEEGEIITSRPRNKMGDYLIYDGKHPAIISEELFEAACEKAGSNPRLKPTAKIRNPFAGLIQCSCGRAMSLRYYLLPDGTERSAARLLCDDQAHCHTGSCTYDEMIEIVKNVLHQKISEYQVEAKASNTDAVEYHARLIKNLEKKLSDLEKRELSQWEAQSDPDPSKRMPQHIFQQLNAKLQQELTETKEALCNAHETMPAPVNHEKRIATLQDALNALTDDKMSASEKNNFLKACIQTIEYHRDRPYREKGISRSKGAWVTPPIEVKIHLKV